MPRPVDLDRPVPPRPRTPAAAGDAATAPIAPPIAHARFTIGDVVRHRMFDFRGVIFDVDPVFANTDEWYDAIPEAIRPAKDQPFYHLLAENVESSYVAYVSQQNLVSDDSDEPVDHPAIPGLFTGFADGRYNLRREHRH
jgi:heat shock protein HspQ